MTCDVFAIANVGVQGLHPYQPGKPIEELQRELGLDSVVKLASNENPLGPSSLAAAAAQASLKQLHLYPDASGFELKNKLAEKLSVGVDQFTLGNGSNDVLDLIARTFLSAGSSAVFSQYAFIVYPIAVQAVGARAIITPAKDWGHDLDAMAAAIEADTKVVFIANPNNPTGNYLNRDALAAFLAKVPEHVIVVLDEAYIEYAEVDDFPDGLTFLAEYSNVIVTRTFSKAYGLAGLRIGYGVSSPQIADLLNRVRAPFNVSIPAMSAALAVLDDHDYLRRSQQVNSAGVKQLCAGFDDLGLPYIPSMGNFVAVELPCDAMPVYQALLQKGVIVRPVGVYQMPKHLRVSVGLEQENMRFLAALKNLINEGCFDK
ncbi:Histidinol-phosphate aminotransferase [Zhongshania aliphaticivorans]|uniref:Histidinol-phosphate aminotransferase n=1 Tax=Zhongshania aliphaticivorans TaxID=1470434 RepID=A0A5S9N9R3_9GAMM|nr:histidinol-phosphate transaminase [Zhongshania aliphaticivorans]CAA0078235.1 Histidinol-phosphate aminotransferase [Zhongshania aliphaticivorans]CAA0086817.1 Histidinol-phosphate aminotransferase [Zhongshania aliphaticivorans]